MMVSNIRKTLLASIQVPDSVAASEQYKNRINNLKPIRFESISTNKIAVIKINNDSIECRSRNTLLIKNSENRLFFTHKLDAKIGKSQQGATSSTFIMPQRMILDKRSSENKEFVRKVNGNKVSRTQNFKIAPCKTQNEILEEKADAAERYLKKLGREMNLLRNPLANFDPLNISISSSITDSSTEKKLKPTKKKLKRRQKKVASNIKKLTLDLILLEAELDMKENKRKRNSFRKSDKQKLVVEETGAQNSKLWDLSPIKCMKKEVTLEDNNEYYSQFKNYKIIRKSEPNEVDKESNISSNCDSIVAYNGVIKNKKKKLKKINSIKDKRKNNLNLSQNILNKCKESNVTPNPEFNEIISEDDFSQFYNAYDNHRKVEKQRLSIHKASDLSTQNKTEDSDSLIENRLNDFSSTNNRRASLTSYVKPKLFCNNIQSESLSSALNDFKVISLPTQNLLNVINGLKQIEDEIEDDE